MDDLNKRYQEGRKRYDLKIPPGYEDDNKKDNANQYGDLIMWFQTIDKAGEIGKPVILITDDRKEDWWYKIYGKTIGPRPELINEFKEKTGMMFYLYQAGQFMKYANVYLNGGIEPEAIEEVESIRIDEEQKLISMGYYIPEQIEKLSNIIKEAIAKDIFVEAINKQKIAVHNFSESMSSYDELISEYNKKLEKIKNSPDYQNIITKINDLQKHLDNESDNLNSR